MYEPLFELTRGGVVESIHFGAIAVVDVNGNLLAHHGDPQATTYLRSSAKPFQALPFVESGGPEALGFTRKEVALMCASHSGTDAHVKVARALQSKTGIQESDLLCGTHPPYHKPTLRALLERSEEPTPIRHNCSGKHTGMLAFAEWKRWGKANYIDADHPVQRLIRAAFAEMCNLSIDQVFLGIDGCSAPNFAAPLYNVAWAYARLADPQALPPQRAVACRTITDAMQAHPEMVGGPGRLDTRLMEVAQGKLVAKGGAEGFQGAGLMSGALGPDSPGIGVAIKISDGDPQSRARSGTIMEVLNQLGFFSEADLLSLADFGPTRPVNNWRKLEVGIAHPIFSLHR